MNGELPVRLRINDASNPWSGFTSSFEEEQSGYQVKSTALSSDWEALESLIPFKTGGDRLIAINRPDRKVFLSDTHFENTFFRPDATRLQAGISLKMGKIRSDSQLLSSPSRTVRFLLQSNLVKTYAHLESEIGLVSESDVGSDIFRSEWKGHHVYFTSERNERPLHFVIILNKRTGELAIEGL